MRGVVVGSVFWAIAGAIVASLLLFLPIGWSHVVDGYLVFLGAMVLFVLVRSASFPARDASKPQLRRRRGSGRPPELGRLEDQVVIASVSAGDLHYRLRPVLREAAGELLLSRRGVDLDGPAARVLLGDEAWELLRPDREPPSDRFTLGLPARRLEAIVAAIEEAV